MAEELDRLTAAEPGYNYGAEKKLKVRLWNTSLEKRKGAGMMLPAAWEFGAKNKHILARLDK